MTKQEFMNIAEQYEGTIINENGECYILGKNEIASFYRDGGVYQRKRVLCKVGIEKYSKNKRMLLMVKLCLATGLRKSELVNLKLQDLKEKSIIAFRGN